MIYYHGDKSHPCQLGIGLRNKQDATCHWARTVNTCAILQDNFCHFYSAPEWLKVKKAFGYDRNKLSAEVNDAKLQFWNQPEIRS